MFKQTWGKYKRNCSARQVLAEELGYRKEFGCGGAHRFTAIAFLALFKSLHVKIPGYLAKSLGIHHHPIMTHTSSGRGGGGRGGGGEGGGGGGGARASMSIFFWLNYQVGLQSTDYFTPHPFLKTFLKRCVSNIPQKHLNLSISHPETIPSLSLSLRVDQT